MLVERRQLLAAAFVNWPANYFLKWRLKLKTPVARELEIDGECSWCGRLLSEAWHEQGSSAVTAKTYPQPTPIPLIICVGKETEDNSLAIPVTQNLRKSAKSADSLRAII